MIRRGRILILAAAVVCFALPASAIADGPPYDDDPYGLCAGTRDWHASADKNTGFMEVGVQIGSAEPGTTDFLLPNSGCALAHISAERRDIVPGARYRVEVIISSPLSGAGAPHSSVTPALPSTPVRLASADVVVELTAYAMICDEDGCGGGGAVISHALSCDQQTCTNPGSFTLSDVVTMYDDLTAYMIVDVRLAASASRAAPPFIASAAGSVLVDDISVTRVD